MEFDLMNISEHASYNLGWYDGTEFIMDDCAEDLIQDILTEAAKEGGYCKLLRTGFLKTDLIPLFCQLEDEPKLFAHCTKLLLILTQPLECFQSFSMTTSKEAFVRDMKIMLKATKELIHDNPLVIKTMFRELNVLLDHSCVPNFAPSTEDVEIINNCILFLRNLFHVVDDENEQIQKELFLSIFKEGLPDLYKRLMTVDGARHWTVSIIQLLSLIFKDATSVSLMLTLSLATNEDAETQSKFINYANYADEEEEEEDDEEDEEEETDSTTAGVDQVYQLPGIRSNTLDAESTEPSEYEEMDHLAIDEKVLRILNGKSEAQELNQALASFGVTIMQNGFKDLVTNLHAYLTDSSSLYLDESYLTWLLSYFLKFVFLPGMSFSHIEEAISLEIVSFLTFKATENVEDFMYDQLNENDAGAQSLKLRKVHLSVMALREVFHALNYVSNCIKLTKEDETRLGETLFKMASLTDLKQLFILLIRSCPLVEPFRVYLRDVVTTNHVYLLLVEHLLNKESFMVADFKNKFSMMDHVNMFANKTIVRAYGFLLETYEENTPCLNDCIMTMMHHISGDCKKPETLLQLPILNTFMEMYENQFPMGKESTELIEYILCKFEASIKDEDSERKETVDSSTMVEKGGWDSDSSDSGIASSSSNRNSPCNQDSENGPDPKKSEERRDSNEESSITENMSMESSDSPQKSAPKDEYPFLNELLNNVSSDYVSSLRRMSPACRDGFEWVAKQLFETCYVKLQKKKNTNMNQMEEPVAYYFNLFDKSVPIIPFSVEHNNILNDSLFIRLLRQLGFYLHEGILFPRIPSTWNPEKLFRMGKFFSSHQNLKFVESDVHEAERYLEKRFINFENHNVMEARNVLSF